MHRRRLEPLGDVQRRVRRPEGTLRPQIAEFSGARRRGAMHRRLRPVKDRCQGAVGRRSLQRRAARVTCPQGPQDALQSRKWRISATASETQPRTAHHRQPAQRNARQASSVQPGGSLCAQRSAEHPHDAAGRGTPRTPGPRTTHPGTQRAYHTPGHGSCSARSSPAGSRTPAAGSCGSAFALLAAFVELINCGRSHGTQSARDAAAADARSAIGSKRAVGALFEKNRERALLGPGAAPKPRGAQEPAARCPFGV